jgi:hypothetical protein
MDETLRDAALERDDHSCRNCGITSDKARDLHVHHIVPVNSRGRDVLDNLATLCTDCHSDTHDRKSMAHGGAISDAIKKRQENDDEYRHGPAPIGFEKDSGQLVEAENYHRVCEVLDQVARDELSKRKASQELDTSRRTIQRSVEDRAELYGL